MINDSLTPNAVWIHSKPSQQKKRENIPSAVNAGIAPDFNACRKETMATHRSAPFPAPNASSDKEKSIVKKFVNIIANCVTGVKTQNQTKPTSPPHKKVDIQNVPQVVLPGQKLENDVKLLKSTALLKFVDNFAQKNKNLLANDPHVATTVHQLYERAAAQLISEGKFALAFKARAQAATLITFSEAHPLYKLDVHMTKKLKLVSNKQFGAHFSEMDTTIVKEGNWGMLNRKINEKNANQGPYKRSKFAEMTFRKILSLSTKTEKHLKMRCLPN